MIAFIVSVLFIVLGFGTWTLRSDYQIPESWTSNSLLAGTELPDPVNPNSTFTSAGTFFGLAVGAAWIMSMGGYQVSSGVLSLSKDPVGQRAIRYVIGLVGILILYIGLGAIFPRGDGFLFYLLRYIRYALIGWWVTGGAPWIFVRFKLAGRHNSI